MRHVREAFALFARHRRLWRYVVAPLAWSALLYLALLFAGYFLVVPPLGNLFASWGLGSMGRAVALILYGITWFFVSGVVFVSITSLLSSFLWDKLSTEVEELVTGSTPSSAIPVRLQIKDSVQRTALSLCLALVGLIAGFCIPVVVPILVAAYIGLLDFTAPAFVNRGKLLREQRSELRSLQNRHEFALAAGVVTLLPFVNVLILPVFVAAGTIMVARSGIGAAPPRPA